MTRLTASIGFNGAVGSRPLAATLAWGQNREITRSATRRLSARMGSAARRRRDVGLRPRREHAQGNPLARRAPARAAPEHAPAQHLGRQRVDRRPRPGSADRLGGSLGVGADITVYNTSRRSRSLFRLPAVVSRVPALAPHRVRAVTTSHRSFSSIARASGGSASVRQPCPTYQCRREMLHDPRDDDSDACSRCPMPEVHVPRRPVGTARRHRARCHRRRPRTCARNRRRAAGSPDPRRVPDRQDRRRRARAAGRRAQVVRRHGPRRRPTPPSWDALRAVRRRAAAQARPARSADHRRPRPQGRARQRRRARIDADQQPRRC